MSGRHGIAAKPKLTPEAVHFIKEIYKRGKRMFPGKRAPRNLRKNLHKRVALWFGIEVSPRTIKAIVEGTRWKGYR